AAGGEGLEHAVDVAPRPGAALDGEAGRLVEDEERVVLVQDARAQPCRVRGVDALGCAALRSGPRLVRRQGRDADLLAGTEARARLDAPAIDPDLAGTQQPLQSAVADLREVTAEPAIEADLALVGTDRAGL